MATKKKSSKKVAKKTAKKKVPAQKKAVPAGKKPSSTVDLLPLIPLRTDVVFPEMVVPLVVGRERGIRLIESVSMTDQKIVALATQKDMETEEPTSSDLHRMVCIATILKTLKFPDGTTRIITHGMARGVLRRIVADEPFMLAEVEQVEEVLDPGVGTDALAHHLVGLFDQLQELMQVPEELQVAVMNTREPRHLADLIGSGLPFSLEEKQSLLREIHVPKRIRKLTRLLTRQLEVLKLSSKIESQVGSAINKMQRDHFLREQLKAIRAELGEGEEFGEEIDILRDQIYDVEMPEDATEQALRELNRLAQMHPSSAEYNVTRTYLDWLVQMPWHESKQDRIQIKTAVSVLDQDHYGLEKIKDRIVEHLSVRKLKKDMKGPIMCFVGPPGTGKTSLGRSIARALNRDFVRISLGGVRDEAEIRGHRRTYVAAMPGRIIQGLHKVKSNNPVFMLDEVDKLGADFRGDPTSALLEVLDPEQNHAFRDHYLDVTFDLSKTMFIATANALGPIPAPLLDRMEILELSGYSEEEKIEIALRHLIPKQLSENGLKPKSIVFSMPVLHKIITAHTLESGVRNLERAIGTICRKVARRHAEGKKTQVRLTPKSVEQFLGPQKHFAEVAARGGIAGVATGLAWTPAGGDILFIESTMMPGKKGLSLTGSLGDVMQESARAALSYIRSHADGLKIAKNFFDKNDLHIHVPSGAISKDGPSAGLATITSLVSLLQNKPVSPEVAMTGEITLSGRVLPVGGIREKLLAARRAGVKKVIIPKLNEADLNELPHEVRAELDIALVEFVPDALGQLGLN